MDDKITEAVDTKPPSKKYSIALIVGCVCLTISVLWILVTLAVTFISAEYYETMVLLYSLTLFVPGLVIFLVCLLIVIIGAFAKQFTFTAGEKRLLAAFGILFLLYIIGNLAMGPAIGLFSEKQSLEKYPLCEGVNISAQPHCVSDGIFYTIENQGVPLDGLQFFTDQTHRGTQAGAIGMATTLGALPSGASLNTSAIAPPLRAGAEQEILIIPSVNGKACNNNPVYIPYKCS